MIAGIDLGTTNSLIGIYDAGMPVLFADKEGSRLIPSIVNYSKKEGVLVGKMAQRQQLLDPEQTITSVKSLMGRRIGDLECRHRSGLRGKPGKGVKIALGTHTVSPEEVSAEILKYLKTLAEARLEQKISRAVITVPAYFNDAQRTATRHAGEMAGFIVERIISEPTAAALAYGLDKLHQHAKIAVYDFGGGTFDLSVLQLDQGVFQVLSTHGDTSLGGDNIDEALVDYFLTQTNLDPKKITLLTKTRLKEAARKAKEELSFVEELTVHLPFLEDATNIAFSLTRTTLEKISQPFLQRTRALCQQALADAHLHPNDLDEIILVGGSTRMPMIRGFIKDFFGKEPNLSQHPDEAVAVGAILQGALLTGNLSQVTLLDITPLSLGIETFGGLMNVIIPRNTTIPTKAGEKFTNAVAGQTSMRLTILQGERELAADNWRLGELTITFPSSPKGQARVGVQFEIDANGMLRVLARDIASGKEKLLSIEHAIDVSNEAVEAMIADSLEHAFEDRDARVFTEARLKAEEMLPAVERALQELNKEISLETKTIILTHAARVTAALEQKDFSLLQQELQALDDATQSLATLLIEKAMRANSGQQ